MKKIIDNVITMLMAVSVIVVLVVVVNYVMFVINMNTMQNIAFQADATLNGYPTAIAHTFMNSLETLKMIIFGVLS